MTLREFLLLNVNNECPEENMVYRDFKLTWWKNIFLHQIPYKTDTLLDTRVQEVQYHPSGFMPDNDLSGSIKLRFNADLTYNLFNRYKLPHHFYKPKGSNHYVAS